MKLTVTLIVATDRKGVIGSENGGIPWSLPRDKQHFRAYTEGKWLLVGRKTYGEMTGWFGSRTPIVLTRNPSFEPEQRSHRVASTIPSALALASANGVDEIVVCGGAAVYRAALPYADRVLVTKIFIDAALDRPVTFPDMETESSWSLVSSEHWPKDEKTGIEAKLLLFEKPLHSCRRSLETTIRSAE